MEKGSTLSHYRLEEKLGEGGMGAVWKGTDTTLGRSVAIKILPEIFSEDPDRMARFDREAKVLASLNHPNIAVIHGPHQAEEVHFLAMELVALTLGQPHKLFAGVGAGLLFGGGRLEADADGHRLLMAKSAGETTTETGITLVESWFSEFKRK